VNDAIREQIRAYALAICEIHDGDPFSDAEELADEIAAWAYALGYNAARDDTLTRELARSPRWDDQPSIPAEGAEQ